MSATGVVSCRNPGLNQGPLDLQSNALPTELFRPTIIIGKQYNKYTHRSIAAIRRTIFVRKSFSLQIGKQRV